MDRPQAAAVRPSVLLVDDEAFEDRFKERSPLDRSELARLLEGIREQAPKLLVIDLDLSPGPAPTDDEERAQAALDEVLKAYAPDQLLLATPLPARSYELAQRRLRWMHGLCGAGVRFAHTTLLHSGSHVLRYDPTLPSLGPLAARIAGVQADDRIAEPEPCELVAEQMREIERGQAQALRQDSEPAGRRQRRRRTRACADCSTALARCSAAEPVPGLALISRTYFGKRPRAPPCPSRSACVSLASAPDGCASCIDGKMIATDPASMQGGTFRPHFHCVCWMLAVGGALVLLRRPRRPCSRASASMLHRAERTGREA